MSNFLGDVRVARPMTAILSMNELLAREGVHIQKGMNFREVGEKLSVFLVLPSHEGEYMDSWDESTHTYTFEGHDSTTVEAGGKSKDQLLMYEAGKLSDNGRFYKAAKTFKDGIHAEPLQIQVYEKLEAGAWFDKGIFNLIDAAQIEVGGRVVIKFYLRPADEDRSDRDNTNRAERFAPAAAKAEIWKSGNGRCAECGKESGLRFLGSESADIVEAHNFRLVCATHRGESDTGGLLGW